MNYVEHSVKEKCFAQVDEPGLKIASSQDFLELLWGLPSRNVILDKKFLDEKFFDLKSGLAGDVLQKVSNYRMTLGIVGDFSAYSSKSLKDFIYESNKGRQVVFAASVEDALALLA